MSPIASGKRFRYHESRRGTRDPPVVSPSTCEKDMSEGEYVDLANQLREMMRTAWLPGTEAGDGPVTGSKFAGTPCLGPGESWPTCPRCGAPMALFLQLDLAALPGELRGELGSGLLQMFSCVSRRECATRG